jgi:hypothetical protein
MDGIYVNGARCKSKKALKEAVGTNPTSVSIEDTSFLGDSYSGSLADAPDSKLYYVVGPCPHTNRKWYATIVKSGGTFKVT